MNPSSIAFIGGGNMASAVIGGLIQAGRPATSILVVEPFEAQRDKLAHAFGVAPQAAADARLAQASTVVWAVKPQLFAEAAGPCAAHIAGALQLSVMAGIRSPAIVQASGSARVVRAMPNTPALIGQGIAGLYARPEVSAAERDEVQAGGRLRLWEFLCLRRPPRCPPAVAQHHRHKNSHKRSRASAAARPAWATRCRSTPGAIISSAPPGTAPARRAVISTRKNFDSAAASSVMPSTQPMKVTTKS
jgi:hypothetical protein